MAKKPHVAVIPKPTGRPPFLPSLEQRERVAIAAGAGMSHEEIAIGLGIDRHTLAKHFEYELSSGAYAKRLEVIEAMHQAAIKGSVSAQKAYAELSPKITPPPVAKPEKAPALGKKEIAQRDAITAQAGTDWDNLLPKNSTPQ